jgi:hypothetical protein
MEIQGMFSSYPAMRAVGFFMEAHFPTYFMKLIVCPNDSSAYSR